MFARGGRGVGRAPRRRGLGVGKGALMTGPFKEAGPKTVMMTRHLRRKAARKNFVLKQNPPMIHTAK